jgi:hypothetical protein
VVSGKVTQVEVVADAANFGVRIFSSANTSMCGSGTPYWGYLNKDDTNYDALFSFFMTAWTTSKNVAIYSVKETSGYCRIGYVISN